MHPLVGEVYLYAVDVVDRYVGHGRIAFLHLFENGIDIGLGSKVDAVFGYIIVRECLAELGNFHVFRCKRRQEEGYADESIAAVMAFRVYHAAVSLASDDGSCLFHLRRHVDLADCRCGVCAAIPLRNIAEGTG